MGALSSRETAQVDELFSDTLAATPLPIRARGARV
jgi:hypothetical protein